MFSGIKFVQIYGFMTTINACFYLNGPYNISLAVRHWLSVALAVWHWIIPQWGMI